MEKTVGTSSERIVPSAVCAVITTYQPDDRFPERVEHIRGQVGLVVIVDDGATSQNADNLQRWFGKTPRVLLHHNQRNMGIARALNNGIAIAQREKYKWVVTLDDDTVVTPDITEKLIEGWKAASAQSERAIAVVGISLRDPYIGQESCRSANHVGKLSEKHVVITSGSLLSVERFCSIGRFRDEFFIDWVDYDYCMRARAKGFRVIQLSHVGMVHPCGHATEHGFWPLKTKTTNHNAQRRYYWFRNSTVLAKEYLWHDPVFSARAFRTQLKTLFLVLLFENDKWHKLKASLRGLLHGWQGRLGKQQLCPETQSVKAGIDRVVGPTCSPHFLGKGAKKDSCPTRKYE